MKYRYLWPVLALGACLLTALFCLAGSPAMPISGATGPAVRAATQDTATYTVTLPLALHTHGGDPWIDTWNRQASLAHYNEVYLASEGIEAGWTGDHGSCDAGSTSQAFRDAIALRINYFRAMAGVPDTVILWDEYTAKAQQAALMMSVNAALSHNPPESWLCYTPEGDEAAGSSNLYLGRYGPSAITGYMQDPGAGNTAVGHRRWILYPQTIKMGTGDIPPVDGRWSSNALWVFDRDNMWGPRPETREEYVAWPPPGYVPYQFLFPRWSFSYAGAVFDSSTVAMWSGAIGISLVVHPVVNGYGENTLVWEPDIPWGTPPPADTAYTVLVSNVLIDGQPFSFEYEVIAFDPASGRGQATVGVGEGLLGMPPRWP